jgi:hypothetical protein
MNPEENSMITFDGNDALTTSVDNSSPHVILVRLINKSKYRLIDVQVNLFPSINLFIVSDIPITIIDAYRTIDIPIIYYTTGSRDVIIRGSISIEFRIEFDEYNCTENNGISRTFEFPYAAKDTLYNSSYYLPILPKLKSDLIYLEETIPRQLINFLKMQFSLTLLKSANMEEPPSFISSTSHVKIIQLNYESNTIQIYATAKEIITNVMDSIPSLQKYILSNTNSRKFFELGILITKLQNKVDLGAESIFVVDTLSKINQILIELGITYSIEEIKVIVRQYETLENISRRDQHRLEDLISELMQTARA